MPVVAVDPFLTKLRPDGAEPFQSAVALVKSDTDELVSISRAIYVGVSGDLDVIMHDGSEVVFKAAPVGVLNVRIRQLKSTNTTATNVLALY